MSLIDNAMPWGGLKRVVIAPDHSIVGYLHPQNSNKWEDGTDVNWQDIESAGYNVMVEIPKFYYTKKVDGDRVYFGVADKVPSETDVPPHEWEVCPAFFRDRTKHLDDSIANPIEIDYRYIGAFHGWVDGQGRLRSLPYKMPTTQKTIGEFRNHAKNNGVGWSQFDYYLLYAIQLLYITEYGHPDSQTVIGRGFVDSNSSAIQTGGTLQYGNGTFGETTGKYQMSYRGIEDLWGNVWDWIDGIYSNDNRQIMVNNKGFNDTGSGYKTIGQSFSSDLSGYIGDIQPHKEAGFIIGSNQYASENSGLYDVGQLAASRLAAFSGSWSARSGAGIFHLNVSRAASSSAANTGARLAL